MNEVKAPETPKEPSKFKQFKVILEQDDLKKRFQMVLGKKSNQFISSLLSAVQGSQNLQNSDPKSIISAALMAAALDLPINSNLGFAAIVPYKTNGAYVAQFQIMAKGFIQLAIRSGQYETMNYTEIYEDELKSYNPITKELVFEPNLTPSSQREKGMEDKVVGYYSWFRLLSGFKQTFYMTKEQIRNHAKKYSASYKYDISSGSKSSMWSKDFHPMANKTIIKLLISKWGILSIEMRQALLEDQKVYPDGEGQYIDNPGMETSSEDIVNPFATDTVAIEDQSHIHVDPDATLRKELQELHPNHEPWQIDALIQERKGQ